MARRRAVGEGKGSAGAEKRQKAARSERIMWKKKENPRLDFAVGLFLGLVLGILVGAGLNMIIVAHFL